MKQKKLLKRLSSLLLMFTLILSSSFIVSADNDKYFLDSTFEDDVYILPFIIQLTDADFEWEVYEEEAKYGELTMISLTDYKVLMEYGGEYIPYVNYYDADGSISFSYFKWENFSSLSDALELTNTVSYGDLLSIPAGIAPYTDYTSYLAALKETYIVLVDVDSGEIVERINVYDIADYVGPGLSDEDKLQDSYDITLDYSTEDGYTTLTLSWDGVILYDIFGNIVSVESAELYDADGNVIEFTNYIVDDTITMTEYLLNGFYTISYVINGVSFLETFEVTDSSIEEELVVPDDEIFSDTAANLTVSGIPEDELYYTDSFDITITSDIPVMLTFNGVVTEDYVTECSYTITSNGNYYYSGITKDGVITEDTLEVDIFNIYDEYDIGDRDLFWTGVFDGSGLVQTGIGLNIFTLLALGVTGAGVMLFVKGGKKREEKQI